jgi:type IV secretory pathway VirB9-like protein
MTETSLMKKSHLSKIAVVVAMLLPALAVQAQSVPGRCKTYNWSPGDIITIEAELYKQTHITLPEDALDVIWGTDELWDQNFVKNNVFMKPRTNQKEGAETTASVVGQSGNSYEFLVKRTTSMVSHCVIVKANGSLIHKANWDGKDDAHAAQLAVLQQQLVRANIDKATAAEEAKRQTTAAVKSYRSALSSNYEWTEGEGWFAKSGIESVQDDGRFTYIRLVSDSRGIMSIAAEIDGTPEILEKVYDPSKREYRVAGVYPKFKLKAGESEMTITRRGK